MTSQMTPVMQEEFLIYLQDIKQLEKCDDRFLRKLISLLSNEIEWAICLKDIVDWIYNFSPTTHAYKNSVAILTSEYREKIDFIKGKKIQTAKQGPRNFHYHLTNATAHDLVLRLPGPNSRMIRDYYNAIRKIHQDWLLEAMAKRFQTEEETVTRKKRIPISRSNRVFIASDVPYSIDQMQCGWYIIQIIDKQCNIVNRKHKCGSTHDMKERLRDLLRIIEGDLTIVHWEPCEKYAALEGLVKSELTTKLAPCAMQTFCTETYIASKEELLEVMRACKQGIEGIKHKLTRPERPKTPPLRDLPQYFSI